MTDEPTPESFGQELETVIARHNECFQQVPGYMIAMLLHEASHRANQHGIDVELVEQTEDAYFFQIGSSGALLCANPRPEVLESIETTFAMVDHRGMGVRG